VDCLSFFKRPKRGDFCLHIAPRRLKYLGHRIAREWLGLIQHMGPTAGPVGPNNVGPTSGPHCGLTGPTSGSHRMWGPRNQLYVGPTTVFKKNPLKSDKINSHSIYVAPHKTLWALVKSICTPRTINPQKTPQDFCKTNPLNVYRWRVKSPHTFTHCIMGYNTAHNRIY